MWSTLDFLAVKPRVRDLFCLCHFRKAFVAQGFATDIRSSTQTAKYLADLGLESDATIEDVRCKYLELVKKYHPDSRSPEASAEKFSRILKAYNYIVAGKDTDVEDETQDNSGEKDFGIRHTAPQHRQYLEYGGVGFGTPSQRMRQYQNFKVEKAVDGVYEHQIKTYGSQSSELSLWEKKTIKKTRITKAINRLVEDLIQEAMSKGEFENLSGSGKPFEAKPVHHVDYTTMKVNQILIDSGFVPEWILLDKEIREEIKILKKLVHERRALYGPQPFTLSDYFKWTKEKVFFEEKQRKINKKIDKFNMIVPIMNKQRMHFLLNKYIDQVHAEYDASLYYLKESDIFTKDSEMKDVFEEIANSVRNGYQRLQGFLKSMKTFNE